mmetsp:Transcript_23117/g.63829  ORF Transcript_23117/g.63829 Transcript_23117/m.63829 type:complete len:150 (+) Transcript_23117:1860-2309(+)
MALTSAEAAQTAKAAGRLARRPAKLQGGQACKVHRAPKRMVSIQLSYCLSPLNKKMVVEGERPKMETAELSQSMVHMQLLQAIAQTNQLASKASCIPVFWIGYVPLRFDCVVGRTSKKDFENFNVFICAYILSLYWLSGLLFFQCLTAY